jgi:hypothetical protein
MFLKALFCSIGYFSSSTYFTDKIHFFCIEPIGFDESIAIMTKEYDISSFWIEGDFFFSIGGNIYEIAFDTIKTSTFFISG